MSGPTREEVEMVLRRGQNVYDFAAFAFDDETMHAALTAADPLLRARHVREAVEGLSDEMIARDLSPIASPDSLDGPQWWFNNAAAFRAALLAALTGEGK